MLKAIVLIYCPVLSVVFSYPGFAQNQIPGNYRLLYENDFDKFSLDDFEVTDPEVWRIANTNDNKALELFGKSSYEPRVRSPLNIAVIKGHRFGNFVLEADLRQTGEEYAHRDMCIFWGLKDRSNFYYVHMASAADEHAHNIFLVNDEPRRAIASKTTAGVKWTQAWHKVRIVRSLSDGAIKVFFDDMTTPLMEATDHHFDSGYIGFGSFDDTGMFDNIRIWGDEQPREKSLFSK